MSHHGKVRLHPCPAIGRRTGSSLPASPRLFSLGPPIAEPKGPHEDGLEQVARARHRSCRPVRWSAPRLLLWCLSRRTASIRPYYGRFPSARERYRFLSRVLTHAGAYFRQVGRCPHRDEGVTAAAYRIDQSLALVHRPYYGRQARSCCACAKHLCDISQLRPVHQTYGVSHPDVKEQKRARRPRRFCCVHTMDGTSWPGLQAPSSPRP